LPSLKVIRNGEVVLEWPIGPRPVTLGRGDSNDLVFSDSTVSWHHAVVWQDGGGLWLRDLRSTNGTWLNEHKMSGAERIADGDQLRLGDEVTLRVHAAAVAGAPGARSYAVEDVEAGIRLPFPHDRFHIGTAADADLRLSIGPERAATLIRHVNGEIWLGTDEDERQLEVGDLFEAGGRKLAVREVPESHVPTDLAALDRYGYRLEARLDGPIGPEATLDDPNGHRFQVNGGNRAILLYLLGKRHVDDAEKLPAERGWCTDEEIQSGLWGRQGDDNKLHVLLYRIRADLRKAGFDPWFIEKRHRHVRARLSRVKVG
jgi:hypothetical protein